MATSERPRFLFEPGRVRVGARGTGGIKVAGGTGGGGTGGGGGGRGSGPGKGSGQGKGRGQAAAFAGSGITLAAAFGLVSASRTPVVPSVPDVAALALISTTTLAVDGGFDVSGISGSYNDLICVLIARSAAVGSADNLQITLNNDAVNAHYIHTWVAGANSAATAVTGVLPRLALLPGSTATAGAFSYAQVTIAGYASTTWWKTIKSETATPNDITTNIAVYTDAAVWNSTAAVTRVAFNGVNGNLLAGSQLRIYGRL